MEKFEADVHDEVEKGLFQLDEAIENNQNNIRQTCKENIVTILNAIRQQQESGRIGKLGSVTFVLSRVEISNDAFIYFIFTYGEKMYINTYESMMTLDVSFFYAYLKEIKESCLLLSKKYVAEQLSMAEVEREVYKYVPYFNMYVVEMLRGIFQDADIVSQIADLEKEPSFVILQNEIYEQPYCIYQI